MKQIFPDLWQTTLEHPVPEYPRLTTHAYLLTRNDGNVLFYSTGNTDDHQRIQHLGGITRQYLSHQDEAGPPLVRIKEMFGSQLYSHVLEEPAISAVCPVDVTFQHREVHLDGIEVIPTPGHTQGSTSFLYKSPHGKTYLFTGDTIFPGTDWTMPGEDGGVQALKQSLLLLRSLEPDVVISSAAAGAAPFLEMTPAEWRDQLDRAIHSLPSAARI